MSWPRRQARINMIEIANTIYIYSHRARQFSLLSALPNFAASNLERVTTSLDKKFAQVFGVETTNAF